MTTTSLNPGSLNPTSYSSESGTNATAVYPLMSTGPNSNSEMSIGDRTSRQAPRVAEPRLDQLRYWVGAALTAVIAALAGVAGLVVAHGILHVPVFMASGSTLTPIVATTYGLCAAGIALLAAGLFDGMLHVAPRPNLYYGWLAAMITALATLLPFTTAAGLHSQIALGVTNLAVGLTIALLIPMAAINARTR
ncbi:DUF6069 family protein [Jatrophihabitans sp. DSM 45814]